MARARVRNARLDVRWMITAINSRKEWAELAVLSEFLPEQSKWRMKRKVHPESWLWKSLISTYKACLEDVESEQVTLSRRDGGVENEGPAGPGHLVMA